MDLKANAWDLESRPGGWFRARDKSGMTVFFQVDIADGVTIPRVHVTLMDSPHEPISARTWRRAPFRQVEMYALLPGVRERLAMPSEVDGFENLTDYFDRTATRYKDFRGWIPGDEVISESPRGRIPNLKAPSGGRLADDFLEDVADLYKWAVAAGYPPAPVIAEQASVPVSRVHRWVAQARKRGHLPPAIKGRAG